MTIKSHLLASGAGWQASDVVCRAGPHDRPFEEQRHDGACIAIVTEGTFQYRTTVGPSLLAPGAMLLGNHGHCFECGHEHGLGDRCLSFRYNPEYLAAIVADVPGVRSSEFASSRLPPLPELIPLVAAAETARDEGVTAELEEVALRVAGAVASTLAGARRSRRRPSRRDEQRVSDALWRIEAVVNDERQEKITLTGLARDAAASPYHFLRTFRDVVGMTPYQYMLRTRLHRAAVLLCRSNEPISAIALDAGFDDLSTFNRRFHRLMGMSPTTYRRDRRRPPHP